VTSLASETISRLAHLRDLLAREPAEPARVLRRADRRARRIAATPLTIPRPHQGVSESPLVQASTPIRRPYLGPLVYCPRSVQSAFEREGGRGDLVLHIEAAIPGPACPRWVQIDGFDVQLARTASPLRTRRAWRAVQVRRRQPVNRDPEGAP
jgi:hypothetical protein